MNFIRNPSKVTIIFNLKKNNRLFDNNEILTLGFGCSFTKQAIQVETGSEKNPF